MCLPGSLIPGGDLRGQSLALHFTDLETEAKEREVTSSRPHGQLVADSVYVSIQTQWCLGSGAEGAFMVKVQC